MKFETEGHLRAAAIAHNEFRKEVLERASWVIMEVKRKPDYWEALDTSIGHAGNQVIERMTDTEVVIRLEAYHNDYYTIHIPWKVIFDPFNSNVVQAWLDEVKAVHDEKIRIENQRKSTARKESDRAVYERLKKIFEPDSNTAQ